MQGIVTVLALSLALPSISAPLAPLLAQTPSAPALAAQATSSGAGATTDARPPSPPLPDAPVPASPPKSASGPCGASPDANSSSASSTAAQARKPCISLPNPYARFLDISVPIPLTPEQKAHLAFDNVKDPFNLITIAGTSAVTIGINAHTAYGPGWKGFGRNAGYSLLQDATGEFFGTFLIPSLAHQDPRYRRMPHASIPRRTLHAISHTVITQSDDGATMPNYAALFTTPISAELSNLYVPGINGNGPSTVARIAIGYGTDPIDNLIIEFLPDVAKHVRIRVIFVQRILNQVSRSEGFGP
jgi:hypothetical protein